MNEPLPKALPTSNWLLDADEYTVHTVSLKRPYNQLKAMLHSSHPIFYISKPEVGPLS